MNRFIFDSYRFDKPTCTARFKYAFENGSTFEETIRLNAPEETFDEAVLERTLFLAFLLIGASYYKTDPSSEVLINIGKIDQWQADFFSKVYQEGLSQFAFENQLTRQQLAHFEPNTRTNVGKLVYSGSGILSLQSGGKDSLLLATKLKKKNEAFTSMYVTSGYSYPTVLDRIAQPMSLVKREIDKINLKKASEKGGLNGHVPVTYIVLSIALMQAVLNNQNIILAAIGHEGEEPHAWVEDLPINHQWSKTWEAEQMFSQYVKRYISPAMRVGSPLRQYSELAIARQFVRYAWNDYSALFSSCNIANYGQGTDNQNLSWCGTCPKCANSYVLFAPYVDARELQSIFHGDLFANPKLLDIFKGLLGVEGFMKPFECVGEIEELRMAYHLAQTREGYASLPFEVPSSEFDIDHRYEAQDFGDILT